MESDNPRADTRAPTRTRVIVFAAPALVALATLALLLWSAWPVVRPVPEVEVAQVVFDRSTQRESTPGSTPTTDAPRSTKTVQAAGWLEAEPFFIACTALADGVVESISVLEGQYVEEGTIVAELVKEDSELRVRRARAELDARRAALESAQAELDAAQRTWDEPVELQRAIETGKAALEENEAELARLPALIRAARARMIGFDEELERIERAATRGVANELEVIRARQAAHAQRAEVEALEAQERVLLARVDRLRAELHAAQRDLELRIEDTRRLGNAKAALLGAKASVDRAQAELDDAQLELSRMTIRAPISGYVQERLKAPGDKVMRAMDDPESAHLLHLYDPEKLQVRVDVPLADASHVYDGQPCEVVVEVLPDKVFRGEVLRSTHQADLQKNTLEFKVRVIDPDPVLRPEMLTRVKFLADDQASGTSTSASASAPATTPLVLVPKRALQIGDTTTRVWTITQRRAGRGVLRPVPIESIEVRDDHVLVRADLTPGSLVVVGSHIPKDGQRVAIKPEQTHQLATTEGGAS
jgi:RND family efflux transporter MFP subunit